MDVYQIVITLLMFGIPLIFAITLHEVAHGLVAKLRGDSTAYKLGRVTLNPVPHIDLIGTILVPGMMFLSTLSTGFPFVFGWAKPVPVDYRQLKKPRLDIALVALAGPMINFVMAVAWAVVYNHITLHAYISTMALYGIMINIVLMVLNLLPIPPLDGSKIVSSFMSSKLAYQYNSIERYGFMILILLIMIPFNGGNLLSQIMRPFISIVLDIVQAISF